MPPSTLGRSSKPPSGRYLSFTDREEIALWRAQGGGVREIARRLGRAASTISRGRTHCVRPAQRGHAQRRSGVPGHDGAVACRAGGPPSEVCEAGGERGAAELRSGPAGWRGCWPGRGRGSRAGRALEGSSARATAAPPVGQGVEPRADCPTVAARLSW
jgi:hypothetical protein